MGRQYYCGLGGVAYVLLLAVLKQYGAVAAEGAVHQKLSYSVGIALAYILRFAPVSPCLNKGHAVLGKGAGLIGADYACAAQCFNCGQAADKCIALYHALHAYGQHDGNYCGQALRDCGNRKGYRRHEYLHGGYAVHKAYYQYYGAGAKGHYAKVLAQLGKALLQRRGAFALAVQQVCYAAHLGIHACGGNHSQRGAVGNAAAGVYHIHPVPKGSLVGYLRFRVLFRGNGFACQGGFLALEAGAL